MTNLHYGRIILLSRLCKGLCKVCEEIIGNYLKQQIIIINLYDLKKNHYESITIQYQYMKYPLTNQKLEKSVLGL